MHRHGCEVLTLELLPRMVLRAHAGMKIAASAQSRTLPCGGETGHSFLPQHKSGK